MGKEKTLVDCLIEVNKKNEKLTYGLYNIWFNVYNSKSTLFNSSILASITNAVGIEVINEWIERNK